MKKIVMGIVAHVDAGKTTLSEAPLYRTGARRKLGRVDNGDAFLDPDQLEKKRGITIFSHEAQLKYNDLGITLLDTPGHIDFVAQTEQVLQVLDYAILVVDATNGLEGTTLTLWRLLDHYQVPTFIFINKTDSVGANPQAVLKELQKACSPGCVMFNDPLSTDSIEAIASQDDNALTEYLENDQLKSVTIQRLIRERKVFPCYAGAALKLTGVDDLLAGLAKWTVPFAPQQEFGARVFKISHDKNDRLTWLRVTGGQLQAKSTLVDDQKANQIRDYNGAKFTIKQAVPAGDVCAVTGLDTTFPGQGLGTEDDLRQATFQPVLSYAVDPQGNDIHTCLAALRRLEDEDPQLAVSWSEHLQEIHVHLMGEVQLEVLQQLLAERFHLRLGFDQGNILYKETITATIEGVGHFEPLRHYAEVHLLMEPGQPGSGLVFANQCRTDVLSHNWQQQIMTSLGAKEHHGVLIGAPLTDVKITLVGGRSSIVHSVGGDFREATWRAVRQGLMELRAKNQCQLLEPWYQFRLTVPQSEVGRAINDIQRMDGTFKLGADNGVATTITGTAPVATMRDYAQEVRNYTHGQGQLECVVAGYQPCHNAEEIINDRQYDPVADLENTPDSVFCAHGAGYPVRWNRLPEMAHFPYMNK
ncbi:MAG: TetM/TetW/TetO/TetS family tetracycline resistance ribosomal protection protein [Lactobacillaceae bacterium]|nr:TetM/TetW/TetO/TetS family tetracycline resistance ribosomal protection protein [Lactobacillaceae bacterium]